MLCIIIIDHQIEIEKHSNGIAALYNVLYLALVAANLSLNCGQKL